MILVKNVQKKKFDFLNVFTPKLNEMIFLTEPGAGSVKRKSCFQIKCFKNKKKLKLKLKK